MSCIFRKERYDETKEDSLCWLDRLEGEEERLFSRWWLDNTMRESVCVRCSDPKLNALAEVGCRLC